MRKLLVLMMFVFAGLSASAQMNTMSADKIAEHDMEALSQQIAKNHPNLAFSPTQRQQIQSVLKKRAEEIYTLRTQGKHSKADYSQKHEDLVKKYNDQVIAYMTSEQKSIYLKKNQRAVSKPNE